MDVTSTSGINSGQKKYSPNPYILHCHLLILIESINRRQDLDETEIKIIAKMKRNPIATVILSILVPGLGQIYCGYATRGAAILVATVLMYNLNSIFLPVFVSANPDPNVFWKHWLPRILHDVGAFYSIVFWIWETVDSYQLAKGKTPA